MKLTLHSKIIVFRIYKDPLSDSGKVKKCKELITLDPGEYDIEKIVNPLDRVGYWYVLRGTKTGKSISDFKLLVSENKATITPVELFQQDTSTL